MRRTLLFFVKFASLIRTLGKVYLLFFYHLCRSTVREMAVDFGLCVFLKVARFWQSKSLGLQVFIGLI